jgi:energy-coupling factor transporter ATP-binding protein EcfA2
VLCFAVIANNTSHYWRFFCIVFTLAIGLIAAQMIARRVSGKYMGRYIRKWNDIQSRMQPYSELRTRGALARNLALRRELCPVQVKYATWTNINRATISTAQVIVAVIIIALCDSIAQAIIMGAAIINATHIVGTFATYVIFDTTGNCRLDKAVKILDRASEHPRATVRKVFAERTDSEGIPDDPVITRLAYAGEHPFASEGPISLARGIWLVAGHNSSGKSMFMKFFSADLNDDKITATMTRAGSFAPGSEGTLLRDGIRDCFANDIEGPDVSESLAAISSVIMQGSTRGIPASDISLGVFFDVNSELCTSTRTWESVEAILRAFGLGARFMNPETIINAENICGSEKQRLMIAHMLIAEQESDHRIIILDEPDSEMDFETASLFLTYLRANFANKTILIVSHGEFMKRELAAHRIEVGDSGVVRQYTS